MTSTWLCVGAALCLAGTGLAQDPSPDPFPREGRPEQRAKKNLLEGKAPPALTVASWLNTKAPIALADLRGKVVLLDFWGVW